ncbi:Piso0_000807 [Millerozyma farinosa CBS 7064]|uniref:ornithine carbamoyltransferase n=1 Tax=Pichia sorbitophila (strain ATCC MYA-4447 / BCRC 22081 / CBS 7064 / NBRC 10061 / NRRL Y-12695) TaxID=559304 RepID=G8YQ43_PICSO|nr:Piso0_000807 [Millerozyma farinosa CBS 7064]
MISPTVKSIVGKRYYSGSKMTIAKPRHLINTIQLSNQEFGSLVDKAAAFKKQVRSGNPAPLEEHKKLLGKVVTMLFSKRSTRTRVSTEGAAAYFGASPMFLGKDDIQLGVNETLYDTVKVLSSMTACIFARVNKHQEITDLCEHSNVPIINSLCDRFHPLQAIADLLTIKEAFGARKGLKLAWVGDSNNVINDLAIASLRSGISVSISVPSGISLDSEVETVAKKLAQEQGLSFEFIHDPVVAVKDANIIVTDTWISMGQEDEKQKKMKQFDGFRITKELISKGGAADDWKFMHCLPRHPEEVEDAVFYSENSLVFEEAENRLYAAMAVIDSFVVNKGDLLQ